MGNTAGGGCHRGFSSLPCQGVPGLVMRLPTSAQKPVSSAICCAVRRQRLGSSEAVAARTPSSNEVRPPGGSPIRCTMSSSLVTAVMHKTVDEWTSDARWDGCDQADPVTGQRRSQDRHQSDRPPAETREAGVLLDHLAIRVDVRTTHVEGPVNGWRQVRGAGEVVQHVRHCDRLDPGVASHLGATMSGSRSVRWRSMSNEAEPSPRTTPAWITAVGTPEPRRMVPTSAREPR